MADWFLGPSAVSGNSSIFQGLFPREARRIVEITEIPLSRELSKIIGVFGEGSGEALFAKRASPEDVHQKINLISPRQAPSVCIMQRSTCGLSSYFKPRLSNQLVTR